MEVEVKWRENYSVVSNSLWPHGLYSPWNSPGQNARVSSLSLLQGISQPRDRTQVSHIASGFFTRWATGKPKNTGMLSHSVVSDSCDPMDHSLWGSSVHGILQARILEWLVISSSRGSSRPRNWTWVFYIARRFFTNCTIREFLKLNRNTWLNLGVT